MSESKEVEPNDNVVFNFIFFEKKSIRFYIDALKHYKSILATEINAIQANPLLSKLLDEEQLKSNPLVLEKQKIDLYIDWIEGELNKSSEAWHVSMTMSHGTVRQIKSVCLLYLQHLEKQRDDVTSQKIYSKTTIETLDTALTGLREKINLGVFQNATPFPLMIDQVQVVEPRREPGLEKVQINEVVQIPAPRLATTIEIFDDALRGRCLDLFYTFDKNNQPQRYDTVISEATKVLEDRLRRMSNDTANLSGLELVKFALGEQIPKIKLAENSAEQQGAYQMFRGVFGFIRNPAHHKFLGELQKERVLQILGLIDYLIYLLEGVGGSSYPK